MKIMLDEGHTDSLCWECANSTTSRCCWVRSCGRVPVAGAQITWREIRFSGSAGTTLTGTVIECPDFLAGEPKLRGKSDEAYAAMLEAVGRTWRREYAKLLREEAALQDELARTDFKKTRRHLQTMIEAVQGEIKSCERDARHGVLSEYMDAETAIKRIQHEVLAPVDID